VFERSKIEDSLDLVVRILVKVLKKEPTLLDVLVRIVNRSVTYYAGESTLNNVDSVLMQCVNP
jgi:hypothetical protein